MDSPFESNPVELDDSEDEQYLNDSDDEPVDLDLSQYYEDEFATDKSSSESSSEDEPVEMDQPYELFKNSASQSKVSLTAYEEAQRESLEGSDEEETLKKDTHVLSTSSLIEDNTYVSIHDIFEDEEEVDRSASHFFGSDVSEDEYLEMEDTQENTEEINPADSSDNESIDLSSVLQSSEEVEREREILYASLDATDDDEEAIDEEFLREDNPPNSLDSTMNEDVVIKPSEFSTNEDDKCYPSDNDSDGELPTTKSPPRPSTESLDKNEWNPTSDYNEDAVIKKNSNCSLNSSTASTDKRSAPKQVYTAKIEDRPPIRSRIAVPRIVTQSKSMPLKPPAPRTAKKPVEKSQPVRKSIRCESNTNTKSRGDVRATYSSMTTFHTQNKNISEWLSRKDEEKRQKQLMLEEERRLEEEKKLVIMEMERKNFQEWLQKKVKQEHQKRAESMIKSQTERLVEKLQKLEKHKQDLENEERFKTWLQKKEEENRKKKRVQNLKEKKAMSEKEKRIAENEDAYKKWLENSKYKQKPIPLNRGLDSLRSAVSVGYINPIPWVPNIEPSSLEE